MRMLVWGIFLMFLAAGMAGAATNVSDHEPVEITSTGETTYENGVATARDNVAIHVGDTDIYGDFAQYNSRTHEVSVEGHVRIYRDVSIYLAERGVYNIDTKQIRTSNVHTDYHPYLLSFTCTRGRCGFMRASMWSFKTSRFMSARSQSSGGPTCISRSMTLSVFQLPRPT